MSTTTPTLHSLGADRDAHWVLATPFRAHLRHLGRTTGVPWRALALAAGVEPTLVRALLHGRGGRPLKRLHPEAARRLLELTPRSVEALRHRRVVAGEVPRRLRELRAAGVGTEELADWLQVPRSEVLALLEGPPGCCTQLTALLTEALWSARGLQPMVA